MYIGDRKISSLSQFLNGVLFTLNLYEIKKKENEPDLDEFHRWTANYYGLSTSMGWNNIILSQCNNDEENALEEFFRLYDMFKKDNAST